MSLRNCESDLNLIEVNIVRIVLNVKKEVKPNAKRR